MILFVIPKPCSGAYGSGNWKDAAGISLALKELGYPYRAVDLDCDEPESILPHCTPDVSDLVLNYSFFPNVLEVVRREAPWVRLHVRAHNAEAFQHWQRYGVKLSPRLSQIRQIYGSARLLYSDLLCRRRAHTILGISEWDNANYWARLPGGSQICSLPYYCPWPYLRPATRPMKWETRENAVVCLAGGRDRIGNSMVEGFFTVARRLGRIAKTDGCEFLISPGVQGHGSEDRLPADVTRTEPLDEPWDFLCAVRVVAVLTPLGFGMKTTIIDSLAAGCRVLVHPGLVRRLPESIRNLCTVMDPAEARYADLAETLKTPPRPTNINEILRAESQHRLASTMSTIPAATSAMAH